jgi:RNA-directed DNA polymerase
MRSQTVSTILQHTAEQAKQHPERVFTTLAHHMDVEFLREAYRCTRKDSAPGVDGVTAEAYAQNLEANLHDLHERLRQGRYVAPPVKRVWLDKEDGNQRPIGIPEFEDKIVQRAVVMLMSTVYEQDFHSFSYGFREDRSPHQALHALREQCLEMNIHWIIDADISGFFDTIDRNHLRALIRQRVNDGALLRLIGKWLNAGVLDGAELSYPETGTPQGGVVSPLLANIMLHHVLDEWFVNDVQPRMQGCCFLIRFADDFVIGCEREIDARRIMAVLPRRFGRFGLMIHPQKTAMIAFGKPLQRQVREQETASFDFLGFTHYWARSRRGYWVIKRKTASKRQRRTIKALERWCRDNRHRPFLEQYRVLCSKLRGHYQYYGIRGNYRTLQHVRRKARDAWRRWLSRRSHKGRITWERFEQLSEQFPLPLPRIVHGI